MPSSFTLSNHPNLFNPTTEILFGLSEASAVRVVVYDVLGRAVARLAEGRYEAGQHGVRVGGVRQLQRGQGNDQPVDRARLHPGVSTLRPGLSIT